jgi:hypothetical protein
MMFSTTPRKKEFNKFLKNYAVVADLNTSKIIIVPFRIIHAVSTWRF